MKALALSLLSVLALAAAAMAGGNVRADATADALAAPPPESLVVGAIQSLAVERCVLTVALQVTADAGGGTDSFRIEVWDEGNLVRSLPLSVPADGGSHAVQAAVTLPPISQATPGIGVVLADATVLDIEDPFAASCAPFEIPAANPLGLASLAALLLVAGLLLVRRRAAHD